MREARALTSGKSELALTRELGGLWTELGFLLHSSPDFLLNFMILTSC